MSKLMQFLERPATTREMHPKARYWHECLKSRRAAKIECEFRRRREGLGFGPARLFVTLRNAKGVPLGPPDEMEWDPAIDADLLELGGKALDPANEAERAGMMFGSRFSQLEAEYGLAWFDAVLVKEIRDVFRGEPAVEKKLKSIHTYPPSNESPSYARAIGAIDGVIMGRARALTTKLRYSRSMAKKILVDAMAYFLDEKFMITSRALFGFSSD